MTKFSPKYENFDVRLPLSGENEPNSGEFPYVDLTDGEETCAFREEDTMILRVDEVRNPKRKVNVDVALTKTYQFYSILTALEHNHNVHFQDIFNGFIQAANELMSFEDDERMMRLLLVEPLRNTSLNVDSYEPMATIFTLLERGLLEGGGVDTKFIRKRRYSLVKTELEEIHDDLVKPKLEKLQIIRKDIAFIQNRTRIAHEKQQKRTKVPDNFKASIDNLNNRFNLAHYFTYVPKDITQDDAKILYTNLIEADIQRALNVGEEEQYEQAKKLIKKRLKASYSYEIFRNSELRDHLADKLKNFENIWQQMNVELIIRRETAHADHSKASSGVVYSAAACKVPLLEEKPYPIYTLSTSIQTVQELEKVYRMYYSWDFEALVAIKDLTKRNEAIRTLKIRLGNSYNQAKKANLPESVQNFLKQRYLNLQTSVMIHDFEQEKVARKRKFFDENEIKKPKVKKEKKDKKESKERIKTGKVSRIRSLIKKAITTVAFGAAILMPSGLGNEKPVDREEENAIKESVKKTTEDTDKITIDVSKKAKIVVEDDTVKLDEKEPEIEIIDVEDTENQDLSLTKENIAPPRSIESGKGVLHYVYELKQRDAELAGINEWKLAYALSLYHKDAAELTGIQAADFSDDLRLQSGEKILLPADGEESVLLDYLDFDGKAYDECRKNYRSWRDNAKNKNTQKSEKAEEKPGMFKRAGRFIGNMWKKVRGK